MLILYKRFVIAYCVIVAIAIVDKKSLLSVLYASESLKWPLSNVDKCTYICEEKQEQTDNGNILRNNDLPSILTKILVI